MANFGWSYPPGVSGNEYAISGPDYARDFTEENCPACGGDLEAQGYRGDHWVTCLECDFQVDLDEDGQIPEDVKLQYEKDADDES